MNKNYELFVVKGFYMWVCMRFIISIFLRGFFFFNVNLKFEGYISVNN